MIKRTLKTFGPAWHVSAAIAALLGAVTGYFMWGSGEHSWWKAAAMPILFPVVVYGYPMLWGSTVTDRD